MIKMSWYQLTTVLMVAGTRTPVMSVTDRIASRNNGTDNSTVFPITTSTATSENIVRSEEIQTTEALPPDINTTASNNASTQDRADYNEKALSGWKGINGGDNCSVPYSQISDLEGKNITEKERKSWPCELREYWKSLELFKRVNNVLLSYGTVAVVLTGIICNMMALRTLLNPKMRFTTSHMYLSALAVFDTGNLLFNFLVGVLRGQSLAINAVFQGSEALCMIHSVFVELFNLLGPWIIVCFTVERFICVHYPLKVSQFCSHKRARNTIVGVTLFIFAFSCHKLLVSGFEGDSVFGYKACKTNRMKSGELIYFYVALSTWLPSLAIMILNVCILIRVRKSGKERRQMASQQNKCELNRAKHQESKLTTMLLVVSSAYLILVIPLGVLQSAEITWKTLGVDPSFEEPQKSLYVHYMSVKFLLKCIRTFCFFFYQLNFSINFFLYLLSGDKFREVLNQQYSCCHSSFTYTSRATSEDHFPGSTDSIRSKTTTFSMSTTDVRQ